jgi:murein DD-endopeptidase MepM/ murein hydrolase activator NlpD
MNFGSRLMARGAVGADVAALQFLLAWHGFPSGTIDGVFKDHVSAAVIAFQQWRQLPMTGVAGPKTLSALRSEPPLSPLALAWPLPLAVADRFGPRHQRFHTGIDIPATTGTPVSAAAAGQVVAAGWAAGGWGYRVRISHASGLETISAHLSRVEVRVGQRVVVGQIVGRVGATGDARGPHLHFEARLRGAAIDPLLRWRRS